MEIPQSKLGRPEIQVSPVAHVLLPYSIIATWHFDLPKIKSVQLLNFGDSESWHLCDLRFMSSDNAAASNFLPGAVRAGSPAGGRVFSQHHFRGIITTSMEFSGFFAHPGFWSHHFMSKDNANGVYIFVI